MVSAISVIIIVLIVVLLLIAAGTAVMATWETLVWGCYKMRGWETRGRFDKPLLGIGALMWLVWAAAAWRWGFPA